MAANQVVKKYIADDAIDESKILLLNAGWVRAILADASGNKNIFRLDAADKIEFSERPHVGGSNLQTEADVDAKVLVETNRALAAEAALDSRIDYLEGLDPLEYKGTWNASTNSPSLADGVGSNGDVYRVTVAGTQDLGSGNITFAVGDKVVLNPSLVWEKWDMTDQVTSVNGMFGDVVLNASHILMLDGTTTVEVKLNSLQSQITAEVSRATAAENALDARLDLIEGRTKYSMKKDLTSTDITNGYVDLDHTILAGSLHAFVDRLALHEGAGEDYTLSTVSGKTRVTFQVGANLNQNDNLYFRYEYQA